MSIISPALHTHPLMKVFKIHRIVLGHVCLAQLGACQRIRGSAARWRYGLLKQCVGGMPTVFTDPFDAVGAGAGSAAAAKLLLKLSSPCFENWTAGASCWGYTVLDTAEKHRACRASRAAAAKAALLAPNMLSLLQGMLQALRAGGKQSKSNQERRRLAAWLLRFSVVLPWIQSKSLFGKRNSARFQWEKCLRWP